MAYQMLAFVWDEFFIFLLSHKVVWTQQRKKKGKGRAGVS